MADEKINIPPQGSRVLVAPLDWGLGHATRCIPIIRYLIKNGCTVVLAGEGAVAKLLSQEFPDLEMLPLKGYRVRYGHRGNMFLNTMLKQTPRLFATISNENRWLKKIMKEYAVDYVISDNRYGLYNDKAYTIFITHQLHIPAGNNFMQRIAQKINYRFINRFNECWVPDVASYPGLAFELSHPKVLPKTAVHYTGILSRWKKAVPAAQRFSAVFLVSGPEPQRTIFEQQLLHQADRIKGQIALVRGLPSENIHPELPTNVTAYAHLPANALENLLNEAPVVVCRSGYSTLMDLRTMGKKAIIMPTPGQKEQEYLAEKNNGKWGWRLLENINNLPGLLQKMQYEDDPSPEEAGSVFNH